MRKIFTAITLLATLSLHACDQAKPTTTNEVLNQSIYELIPLVEEALVRRQEAITYLGYLKEKPADSPLSSADLNNLYDGALAYLKLREKILAHAHRYRDLADPNVKVNYGSADGALFMKQIKYSLAAALVLYDNYLIGINPYLKNEKFRQHLTRDSKQLDGKFTEITESYLDTDNRTRAAFGISHFLKQRQRDGYQPMDKSEEYLDTLISQSPSFTFFKKNAFRDLPVATLTMFVTRLKDDIDYLSRIFTFAGSKFFGNAVGLIEERKGMLLSLSEAAKQEMAAGMEPLDILLEKTPFRLTDKFIPGHWGHVAIWVGNEAQLRALGVWEHPVVKPHQNAIRSGHSIVEALRPGVQINTLEHFLNIDDFVALRREDMPLSEKQAAIVRTFKQIGKDYDFNFDVETDTRIVCSEIAYVVFTDLDWQTSKQLGRHTISPDNVAIRGTSRNPFTPVMMYHDGQKVPDRLDYSLQLLLDENYRGFAELHPGFYRSNSSYRR